MLTYVYATLRIICALYVHSHSMTSTLFRFSVSFPPSVGRRSWRHPTVAECVRVPGISTKPLWQITWMNQQIFAMATVNFSLIVLSHNSPPPWGSVSTLMSGKEGENVDFLTRCWSTSIWFMADLSWNTEGLCDGAQKWGIT